MLTDLGAARTLKQKILAALGPSPFAVGIRLERAGEYRVAVIVCEEAERRCVRNAIGAWDDMDIEIAGVTRAASSTQGTEPTGTTLRIGASVGHRDGGVGSLGFFATRRVDGKRGFVSCNHVIAMVDEGQDGDAVVSPSTLDGGGKIVAALDGTYPRLAAKAPADCAFASLVGGVQHDPATLDGGTLALDPPPITHDLRVAKVGRVTGVRLGVVQMIEVDNVCVRYGMMRVAFDGVIQIGSVSGGKFCEYGDSGALVYTADTFQPIGLLFATSFIGGPHNAGWTWVHPIRHVTEALQVDLVNA
jgi:hypothetical protein